jgi:hypothetical protein
MMFILAMIAAMSGGSEPKIEIASPIDCAVVVAIGKSQVAWGQRGPNQPFIDEGPLLDGTVYRQICDWRSLGVGAPTILKPGQTGPRFAIEKPIYSQNGTIAEADLNLASWNGPGTAPFASIQHCTIKKKGGAWRLLKCEQGPIT